MPLVLKDRVQETTTTTGTGAVTLDGASTGYQTFDAIGNFNQTYYTITDGTNWEAGIGTFGELESSAALSLAFDETTTLDNRITFTRATNGTYFDSAGVLQTASSGVARFDHRLEGGVWVNKGLLIEEQRTNSLQRSEEFGNAYWTLTNLTITVDNIASPDGNTTADKVLETTTNGTHTVSNATPISINMTTDNYSASMFVKGGLGRTQCILQVLSSTSSNNFYGTYNLSTLTATTTVNGSAVALSASIQDAGNGWYRIAVSGRTGVNTTHQISFYCVNDSGSGSYAGDVTKGFYIWGAQLESGAFPTSYIKTTTASVTRNADVASMTGTNFSSWYNATEGTIFQQVSNIADPEDEPSFNTYFQHAISNNTSNERLQLSSSFSSPDRRISFAVSDGGTLQVFLPINITYSSTATYKSAYAAKENDFSFSVNGSSVSTDTSGTMPTPDRLYLGTSFDGSFSFLNGHIAKFYYWNTRLSNGTLQYLSSSFGSTSISRRLNRDTVLASSNSGNLVNFSAGTKTVFSPLPAIATQGSSATADDSSIGTDLVAWNNFKKLLNTSVIGGVAYGNNGTNGIVSTYSLVYTTTNGYSGGVLAPNGDIHFVPFDANRGQKINTTTGVVSTYSLVYTAANAYAGGVLAPNGDIHFVKFSALVGQKVSASGVVSTYSLVYTIGNYFGGVLAPNGDIHFIPFTAPTVGQKISPSGVVSTYSLAYTATTLAYQGGVLAPNGDIHFVPRQAPVGQKISAAGVVSTYSLVYTSTSITYIGGVVAPNGDIHFIPRDAAVGQKVSISGVVSTYSLVLTAGGFAGGVLAPNGDIHFVPGIGSVGQKISATGVVSTYSLIYTNSSGAYSGGILAPNGNIYFIPRFIGQIIHTNPGIALGQEACLSSYLNKL